jgi:hypothetical protein
MFGTELFIAAALRFMSEMCEMPQSGEDVV